MIIQGVFSDKILDSGGLRSANSGLLSDNIGFRGSSMRFRDGLR